MNYVKEWREKLKLTQNELAEKSGVSLRTIQRIEAGSVLKGYTLSSIANALDIKPENLIFNDEVKNIDRAKSINLSVLLGFIIPFGSIIFPLILTTKTKDLYNKQIGKSIVEIQIINTIVLSIFLILCPFIQREFHIKKPIFIYLLSIYLILKLIIVIINGISLNKTKKLYISLKNNFL